MWTKWQSDKNYDHLDKTGKYAHGYGRLPTGVRVRFSDGDVGTVIEGNGERSLVSHAAPSGSGAFEERAWYQNKILEVKE